MGMRNTARESPAPNRLLPTFLPPSMRAAIAEGLLYAARAMGRLRYAGTLFGHLWRFAAENKAWWIVPLVLVLGVLAVVIFAGQASTPFIYTLW